MANDNHKANGESDALWEELGKFLDPENRRFDADEEQGMNPILAGLRQGHSHYSEPELVCEGGEKQIYRVRDLRTDRVIAMAKPLARTTDTDKELFLREARLTACLQHPNIITVYDQGVRDDDVPYFTMTCG